MILNFGPIYHLYLALLVISPTLFLMTAKNLNYLLVTDILSRIFLDDFYFNMYYFAWTSLWYLSLSVPILIFYKILRKRSSTTGLWILTSFFIWTSLLNINEYWTLNTSSPFFSLDFSMFNTLLLNSLNKYHPFFLYSSLSIFWIWFIYNPQLGTAKVQNNLPISSPLVKSIVKLLPYLVCINILALILGSWWAFQEGSWGGWWNWDISEIFGLCITLCLLALFHDTLLTRNKVFLVGYIFKSGSLLVMFYFFMQLNFNLISHNFGLRSVYFLVDFNYLFFLIVVAGYYFTLCLSLASPLTFLTQPTRVKRFLLFRLSSLGWRFPMYLLLFYTLVLLLNNFIFLYLNLNFFNWLPNFKLLTYLSFVLAWSYSWNIWSGAFYQGLFFLVISWLYIPLLTLAGLFSYFSCSALGYAHYKLLFLAFLSYLLSPKTLIYWGVSEWGFNTSTLGILQLQDYSYPPATQLNTPLYEFYGGTRSSAPMLDFNYTSTTFNNKIFSLPVSSCNAAQQFYPNEFLPNFSSSLYETFLVEAILGFMIWSALLLYFMLRNYPLEK